MKVRKRTRITAVILAFMMVLVMMPGIAASAYAAGIQAPENVALTPTVSEAGVVSNLIAKWDAVDSAEGYIVTPCKITNGKWEAIYNPVDVKNPEVSDGVASYDITEEFFWYSYSGTGLLGVTVQAYDSEGNKSAETRSSDTVEAYRFSMEFDSSGSNTFVVAGANVPDIIEEMFDKADSYSGYYESGGSYYYRGNDWESIEIICFVPRYVMEYTSLEELMEEACFVPREENRELLVTGDITVYAVDENAICPVTGDLHHWERFVEKATIEDWGSSYYECQECGTTNYGGSIPPVTGFELKKTKYTYTGKAIKPAVTVNNYYSQYGYVMEEGKNFKVTYSNNKNAGTATAKITLIGDYEGTGKVTFQIKPAKVTDTKIGSIADKAYTGKAIKPAPSVKLGSVKMKAGTDYTVVYSDNTEVGTAQMIIVGKGNLSGATVKTFKIVKASNPLSVTGKTATIKYSDVKKADRTLAATKIMTFKSKGQGKLSYTKSSGDKKILIDKKTGKLTVKKGLKKGTYKVKIKVKAAGNSSYKAGTKTVTVTVKVQ